MQSKWLFRWKIRATAFYLGRLGSKPCSGHKLKLVWCSCPSSQLCSWHNCYSFRHNRVWLAGLAPRQAAHGSKEEDTACDVCWHGWKKGTWKGRRKKKEELRVPIAFSNMKRQFLSTILVFFFSNGQQAHWGRAVFLTFDSERPSYVLRLPPDRT